MHISYEFQMNDGRIFDFDINPSRGFSRGESGKEFPNWTKLSYNQCSNCTFKSTDHEYCPTALDVLDAVDRFKAIISYEKAFVIVKVPERTYTKECAVQDSLKSLLGLIMSTSGCEILSPLKGMAYFHLPFASLVETLNRTVGHYLIKQYFEMKNGGNPDWGLNNLSKIYDQLQILNNCFTQRIRGASKFDANINAIVNLFALSSAVSESILAGLDELREYN